MFLPRLRSILAASAFLFCATGPADAQNFFPLPLYPGDSDLFAQPWSSTGLVRAKVGRSYYFGSGAVARDPKLVYGCAHVVYENGTWASTVEFARGYSDVRAPKSWGKARGFHILGGYTYNEGFDYDFSVAYSPGSFGVPVDVHPNAVSVVTSSSVSKMILGYPSYRDYDYESGFHYMHQTGPFQLPFVQDVGPHYTADNVSTGPGNSGGPVLVNSGGAYQLAGILVSGAEWPLNAGIYTLGADARTASDDALYDAENGTPIEIVARTPIRLKDGSSSYRRINFNFRKGYPSVTAVSLALQMAASPAEADVFLRSPSGRQRVVVTPANKNTAENLNNNQIDLSSGFAGASDGSGNWTLWCRDARRGTPAVVWYAALTVTAR